MPDDPNKKSNEGSGSSGQTGQQSGQKHDISNESQKRPSQGGPESEQDRNQNEQGGQRRAS
jgi:hypothetical protein